MSDSIRCLGLDIGGANLKAATTDGYACELAFPLWKQPEGLAAAVEQLICSAPPHEHIAVTMTGELADCYASKAEGVQRIVDAVVAASRAITPTFFSMSETFIGPEQARQQWQRVAASNWYALGLARPAGSLLIDVGSTTTDIIPNGTSEMNDTERLQANQLLYLGVVRTPLCALVDTLPYRDSVCPVAAEWFATTADVSLMLGKVAESSTTDTADGRPLTKPHSIARLARMICADTSAFCEQDAIRVSEHLAEVMEKRVAWAVGQALNKIETPPSFLVSGSGEWLARAAILRAGFRDQISSLSEIIGEDAARCAPAWAVATLFQRWSKP